MFLQTRTMLHILLVKPTRGWTQVLFVSLRSSVECREVTYVIDRCCERYVAGDKSPDPDFARNMYAEAEKLIASGGKTR